METRRRRAQAAHRHYALCSWARWYDSLLDRDFEWSHAEEADFDREGGRLWRLVANELGPHYKVGYFSEVLDDVVWDPSKLPGE